MLIKSADDKSPQIAALEFLLTQPLGPLVKKVEEELRILRAGIKAEQDAAYLIDFDFKDSLNSVVLHDLRFEINGRVAQIDHLLIHRTLNVFVLETKAFHAGLKITEQGEFLRWNDWKKTFEGMASPLAQNERHITVLKSVFEQIEMPTRLGIRLSPTFHSIILVEPSARIDRPKKFDTQSVIKADMLLKRLDEVLEQQNVLAMASKFVATETIAHIAQQLLRQHRPFTINYASRFGITPATLPKTTVATVVPSPAPVPAQTAIPAPVPKQSSVSTIPSKVIASKIGHACRNCQSDQLSIQYGKYGYYFKCAACQGNTAIKLSCGHDGHKERIRKDGLVFYRECADCKTSSVFFSNPN